MPEVTETLDETGKISGRYVILHNLLRDIKEAEPLIQHLQKTISNYDEKKLFEVDYTDWSPKSLAYKLSDKEYDLIKNDGKLKENIVTNSEGIEQIGPLKTFERVDEHCLYDHRASTIAFPESFIVKNGTVINDHNFSPDEDRLKIEQEMELTTKKLRETTMLPTEEKRHIADFLNSPDNSQVWRSKTLTPEGRIAAAAMLSGTEHGNDLVRDLPKLHQDIVATLKRVQTRGNQRQVEACL